MEILCFYSSEYGEIVLRKNSEQLKPDEQEIVDGFKQFMSGFWKTSDLNKETVENHNAQVQEAQEIHNYLKKLPADLYLSLFHIMQQEVTGLPCAGNYCV